MDWIRRVQRKENFNIFLLELREIKNNKSLKCSVQGQAQNGTDTECEGADEGGLQDPKLHNENSAAIHKLGNVGRASSFRRKIINSVLHILTLNYLQNMQEQMPMRQLDKLAWF